MSVKDFTLQRICIFAGMSINPKSDEQVKNILRYKFNIDLPQRSSLDDALEAVASDKEIIRLIIKYRSLQ